MIKEFDRVILLKNIPEYNLIEGDIGTIVMVHEKGKGFEVEFMTLDGETVIVETLSSKYVRPISPNEIAHVRKLIKVK